MAFKLAEAVVDIKANDKDLDAKLAGARTKLGRFFDSVKTMAVPLAGVIGSAVVAKLTQYIGDAAVAAGDLNETLSKTEVVFGSASGAVVKFADDMNAQYGSARNEILSAAADIGIVGKAIKLSAAESAAFSIKLVKLADDAASLHNVGLADALDRIKAALRGESDPIEKLGVMMNEAAVNAEIFRLGLAKTAGEITNAMKIQGRYSLVVQGLAIATGDHARTQDGFNNQLKEFKDRLGTLATSVGQLVLPAFNSILKVVNPIIQAIDSLVNKIREVPAAMAALRGGMLQYGSQIATGKTPAAAPATKAAGAATSLPDDPFKAAGVRVAAEASAKKAAGDVSFFKSIGWTHMLTNVRGSDGKTRQEVMPQFQQVVDNARLKTEGMMSSLKEKAGIAAATLDQLKQGAVGVAAKGIEALAPKPRMAGGVTDVDSFQRDLQSGALNAEKSAEETAKNTGTAAGILGEIRDLIGKGRQGVLAILS